MSERNKKENYKILNEIWRKATRPGDKDEIDETLKLLAQGLNITPIAVRSRFYSGVASNDFELIQITDLLENRNFGLGQWKDRIEEIRARYNGNNGNRKGERTKADYGYTDFGG